MLYDDGVASQSLAPSRASAVREGGGEASVGVVQAEGSSREIVRSPGCRRSAKKRKALPLAALSRAVGGTLRGHSPLGMYEVLRAENREAPWSPVPVGDASSLRGSRGGVLVGAGREGNASAVSP